jgi:hypothetical protein
MILINLNDLVTQYFFSIDMINILMTEDKNGEKLRLTEQLGVSGKIFRSNFSATCIFISHVNCDHQRQAAKR